MKQFIVDAFTDTLFKGNQAAVCVMDKWIPDELMQNMITSRIFRTFFLGSPGQVLLCLKSGHHGRLSRTHGPDVYLGFW